MRTDKMAARSWRGVVFLAAALLAGCGAMSKSDCEKADWRQLGRQDAEHGQAASVRFAQRAESCSKAGIGADQAEYMAGHAQGQASYCTAARGRDEALAGQPASAVCQVPAAAASYRSGYNDGLQRFCTAKSGFDFGRFGATYRNTCPAESAVAFQTGYLRGRDLYELNRRLERIGSQQAEERKLLADPKITPTGRDAANRRLGQLDADEASVRRMIRQAEIDALPVTTAPAPTAAPAISAEQLLGHWELKSLKFAAPVDLNRDGVSSTDARDEYKACERDVRLEVGSDRKGAVRIGANTAGCKPVVRLYDWHLVDGRQRIARQESGRRVVDERIVKVLQLRNGRITNAQDMIIDSVDADALVVRAELPDGSDSTSMAVLTYARIAP